MKGRLFKLIAPYRWSRYLAVRIPSGGGFVSLLSSFWPTLVPSLRFHVRAKRTTHDRWALMFTLSSTIAATTRPRSRLRFRCSTIRIIVRFEVSFRAARRALLSPDRVSSLRTRRRRRRDWLYDRGGGSKVNVLVIEHVPMIETFIIYLCLLRCLSINGAKWQTEKGEYIVFLL